MMNIKNIFVTTSISIVFGVYSLYNIVHYIQRLEIKHHNHVDRLNKIIDETYQKYENIKNEYLKMKEEIVSLNNKILTLEAEMKYRMSNDKEFESSYISSNTESLRLSDITDINDIVCDSLCNLSPDYPSIPSRSSSNSLDSIFSGKNVDGSTYLVSEEKNEYLFTSAESITRLNEIFNDFKQEHNIDTPPPSKNSSFCGSETASIGRKRSLSVNQVNWIDITKKFIFG
jgi:hypothetical protein